LGDEQSEKTLKQSLFSLRCARYEKNGLSELTTSRMQFPVLQSATTDATCNIHSPQSRQFEASVANKS
jgi:hypothetical protein